MGKIKSVCVFASSCDFLDKSYYADAAGFGKLLAQNGMSMVYGGSSLGMMWACASEVKKNGGKLYGVMPERLFNMGVSTDECVELTVTPCMRTRKAKMDELSDAVVALAGGFGTLEELSEMIVQKQLGKRIKELRENRQISQEQIAEKLNIHPANYWRIENGISYPKPENLEKICEILNVKAQELFAFEHIQSITDIKNELQKIINEDEDLTRLIYKFVKTLNG